MVKRMRLLIVSLGMLAGMLVGVPNATAQDAPQFENITGFLNAQTGSHSASISADGDTLVFVSSSGPEESIVYVLDRPSGKFTKVNVVTNGSQEAIVSGDGSTIAIVSRLQIVTLWDRATEEITEVANMVQSPSYPINLSLSHDGSLFAFEISTRGISGVQVWERSVGLATFLPQNTDNLFGLSGHDPAVSADGSEIWYNTTVDIHTDPTEASQPGIYVWDKETQTSTNAELEGFPEISADGSTALVSQRAPDVLSKLGLLDRVTGEFKTITGDLPDVYPNATNPAMSADGSYVVFESRKGDRSDIVLWSRTTGEFQNLTKSANGKSWAPVISGDGSIVAFNSEASNLSANDTNEVADVFVWERPEPEPEPEPGTIANAETVTEIVESSDYNNVSHAQVLRLYQAIFGRYPDVSGAKYWIGINNNGSNVLEIAGFMSASQEWANTYEGTTDEAFVAKVYVNVLGREFDTSGYDYWLNLVKSDAISRYEMVYFVTANSEFITQYPFTNTNN